MFGARGGVVVEALRYKPDGRGFDCWPLVPKIEGSLPTEAFGTFLLEKSTACSTIGYKRPLKVQYQNNEAQDTSKKNSRWCHWIFSLT
jgi:hypothetical protein